MYTHILIYINGKRKQSRSTIQMVSYWMHSSWGDSLTDRKLESFLNPFNRGAQETWARKPSMDKLHPNFQSPLFVQVTQDIIITLMGFSYFCLQVLWYAHCNLRWKTVGEKCPHFHPFLNTQLGCGCDPMNFLMTKKDKPFVFSFSAPDFLISISLILILVTDCNSFVFQCECRTDCLVGSYC